MRWIMTLAVACALGCSATREPRVVVGSDEYALDGLLAARPLAADANIRADEVARTTGASVHLVQVRRGESPHRHATHDLTVAVLRGRGRLTVDDTVRAMMPGDVAIVRRGTVHWFVNDDDHEPSVALVVFTPPLDAPDTVPADVDRTTGDR